MAPANKSLKPTGPLVTRLARCEEPRQAARQPARRLSSIRCSKGHDLQFRTNAFDVWVFRRDPDAVRYLLLHTSQEKANRWFNGGRFWQVPGEFVAVNETIVEACRRCLAEFGITALSLWAVEHTYTIYNRRREDIELILVLAAEAQEEGSRRRRGQIFCCQSSVGRDESSAN